MEKQLDVSVVINTHNRAESLKVTLESLFHQMYKNFEVIVVNGPSTDQTEKVVSEYGKHIKLLSCPVRNLSVSRNIGIEAASGEIVAFIDDDGIADPYWIADLAAGYTGPEIGGVGGLVYDYTGMQLQYQYSSCDRNGDTDFGIRPPFARYCVPQAEKFLYLQGTNCSFRKTCLEEIGGFDEEFEYYLDEVDVCMRIMDLGYRIRPLDHAAVHHKYVQSYVRNEEKIVLHPYSTVKNRYYFAIKNNREKDLEKVKAVLETWTKEVRDGGKNHFINKKMTKEQLDIYLQEVDQGCRDGLARGMEPDRTRPLSTQKKDTFCPFAIVERKETPLKICYLSREYPPDNFGGIGRYTYDLATTFAAKGHEVHVITEGNGQDTIDFEDGVWVHRLVSRLYEPFADMVLGWNFSLQARNYFELERIHKQRPIDLVHGPIWLCETGMANCCGSYPVLLTLMTTQKILNHLSEKPDKGSHAYKLMKLEEVTIRQHKNIHAISRSILKNCRETMRENVHSFLTPLGCRDLSQNYQPEKSDKKTVVYTVGRLEHRKGIDLLLQAAETILSDEKYRNVEFVIAGKETANTLSGRSDKAEFLRRNQNRDDIRRRVRFLGEVSEDILMQNYADADIVCVPSRYESFGIVVLEGMSFSNAVVAAYTGGMKDIIKDGTTGLFFEPENVEDLTGKLKQLLDDADYRKRIAQQAAEDYRSVYSLEAVYDSLYEKYCEIRRRFSDEKHAAFRPGRYAKMIAAAEGMPLETAEEIVRALLKQHHSSDLKVVTDYTPEAEVSLGYRAIKKLYRIIARRFPGTASKLRGRWLSVLFRYRQNGKKGVVRMVLERIPVFGRAVKYMADLLLLPLRMKMAVNIGAALMNHDELLRQMGDMETGTRELLCQMMERVETVRSVCNNHDELLRQMSDMETGTRELLCQLIERVETVRSVCERQIQKGMEEETGALKQLSLLLSRMAEKNHYEMEDYSNLIVDKMNDRLMDVRSEILFELLRNGQAISATKVKGRILNKVKVDTARKCGSVRLNLGAGHICFDDYINVDERQIRNIDIVADVRELPFTEQSVDEIYASHIIEHFTRHEFETVILPYWYRLLKAGGKIRVILPDLESMIEHYKNQQYEIGELREVLYGLQEYPGDVHYALYGQNELKEMFGRSGLNAEYAFVGRRNGKCYDMELVGMKV